VKGTAFRPSVVTEKRRRLEPIGVAKVMYELKLVPFTPLRSRTLLITKKPRLSPGLLFPERGP
jgi:hypothetical protein